jgi:hypothetical protein
MTNKPTGYLLHEDADIVVIATTGTRNPKTGDMVQVWILPRSINPMEAIKTGQDSLVCVDCKHRGVNGKGRTCYVRVANAPLGIWKKYQRGGYPTLAIADYAETFAGRKIRFGAYGEPVLIPLHIVRELAYASDGWTGYTHQWSNPAFAPYAAYIVASVDTPQEYREAKFLGWRTFRVRTVDSALLPNEITCPASDEAGKRTTCADCRLCNGSYVGDPRKDIAIIVHGIAAKKFIQIGA